MKLVESIAKNYSDTFKRQINPFNEVLVSSGALWIIYSTITSIVELGDEVILIEPCYDCYFPQIQFCGGNTVGVPMIPPKSNSNKWTIDFEKLIILLLIIQNY
jgi:aspartate/methionine/tyrosine aminotransferase